MAEILQTVSSSDCKARQKQEQWFRGVNYTQPRSQMLAQQVRFEYKARSKHLKLASILRVSRT